MRLQLAGQKFGRLTVVEFAGMNKGKSTWRCVCECSKTVIVVGKDLKSGNTKSCGCSIRKHGHYQSPTYTSWQAMKRRCLQENFHRFPVYGGAGVRVCDAAKLAA